MRNRRWRTAAGIVGTLMLLGGVAALLWWRPPTGHDPMEVASWIATLFGLVLAIVGLRQNRRPAPAAVAAPDEVEAAVAHLANYVDTQWRTEALVRGLPLGADRALEVAWVADGTGRAGGLPDLVREVREMPVCRLVILGPAGSGKTSLAILLMLSLLSSRTPGGLVPVLVNASEWNPEDSSFEGWMLDQITQRYPGAGSRNSILTALRQRRVVPVLDGLDEIPPDRRARASHLLKEIRGDSPLIVTARPEAYEESFASLSTLAGSRVIHLAVVDPFDALDYIAARAEWPDHTKSTVRQRLEAEGSDGALGTALMTPLMASLACSLYAPGGRRGEELADAHAFPSAASIQGHLIASYVPLVYERNLRREGDRVARADGPEDAPDPRPWDPTKAERWLGNLAAAMTRHGRTSYRWWEDRPGSIADVALASPALPGLQRLGWVRRPATSTASYAAQWLFWIGLVAATCIWLSPIVASAKTEGRTDDVASIYRAFKRDLQDPLVAYFRPGVEEFVHAVGGGLPAMAIAAGVVILVAFVRAHVGLKPVSDGETSMTPRSVLRAQRRSALIRACAAGTVATGIAAVIVWLYRLTLWGQDSSIASYGVAAVVGFVVFGGTAGSDVWGRFVLLRMLMAATKRAPLRFMSFLSEAVNLGVLRLDGGAFQFRHGLLQQDLARRHRSARDVAAASRAAQLLEFDNPAGAAAMREGRADQETRRMAVQRLAARKRFAEANKVVDQAISSNDEGTLSLRALVVQLRYTSASRQYLVEVAWKEAVYAGEAEAIEGYTAYLIGRSASPADELSWLWHVQADDAARARMKPIIDAWIEASPDGQALRARFDATYRYEPSSYAPALDPTPWYSDPYTSAPPVQQAMRRFGLWALTTLVVAGVSVAADRLASAIVPAYSSLPGRWYAVAGLAAVWSALGIYALERLDQLSWLFFANGPLERWARALFWGWYPQRTSWAYGGRTTVALRFGFPLPLFLSWAAMCLLYVRLDIDGQQWARWTASHLLDGNVDYTLVLWTPVALVLIVNAANAIWLWRRSVSDRTAWL